MHANLSTYQQIISKISGSGGYADGDTMKLRKMSGEYKMKRKISSAKKRVGTGDVGMMKKKYTAAQMKRHDKGQYKQKMKAMKKYKGMKGMKYSGKNKSVTTTADRMQARRRRTNKGKK